MREECDCSSQKVDETLFQQLLYIRDDYGNSGNRKQRIQDRIDEVFSDQHNSQHI